jgi:WD40 repeat protein
LALSGDGKLLASGGRQATFLDLAGNRQATVLLDRPTTCVAFSPDGRTLVCGADVGKVILWDVATSKQRAVCEGHTNWVLAAAFAPDGLTLATTSADSTIRLWDPVTGRRRATLMGHKGPVTSVAYSPDGRMLASACVWQREIRSPGGKITETKGTQIKVLEVATHGERLTFDYEEADAMFMLRCCLQFTSDGRSLMGMVNRLEGDIKWWDLAKLALTR